MLYYAYGSNLNQEQMLLRCPNATPIKRIKLHDYKLVFRGVADIQESTGSYVDGALWNITDECEIELDRYEGVDSGLYSKLYFDYKDDEVLVYKMNDRSIMPPGDYYVHIIKQGYVDFGIPFDSLDNAINESWKYKKPSKYLKRRRSYETFKGIKRARRVNIADE